MSIRIYSYNNPYKLDKELYWEEIKAAPFFCASQTLVNGLNHIYNINPENNNVFVKGKATTFMNLVNNIYEYWQSAACEIKQYTAIDNIVRNQKVTLEEGISTTNLENAFIFNREEIFKSLRVMFELGMDYHNIVTDYLTEEEKYIVEIFKYINESNYIKDFTLKSDISADDINEGISKALLGFNDEPLNVQYDDSKVVILGIHQFSPIFLKTIEILSNTKDVILLFNYMPKYKNVYQTWINIYNLFESKIQLSNGKNYDPAIKNDANELGNNLGKLIDGNNEQLTFNNKIEVTEFDNMTEFSDYVADLFDRARRSTDDTTLTSNNPLANMKEQLFAADPNSNEILKVYFPKQFGERDFLNYPLGHFFMAIANMWNVEDNAIHITDLIDIKECLSASILNENEPGELLSTFASIEVLFEGVTTLDEMIKRISRIITRKARLKGDDCEYASHISYFNVEDDKLLSLINALEELNDISKTFFKDFESQRNNFKVFYTRLQRYLQDKVREDKGLNEDFKSIISRVLIHLDQVANVNATASFECLKSTMSLYLQQEESPEQHANWIVKNFEQIDGDVLRSGKNKVYHFASLSDEDIFAANRRLFPWPLTEEFFEDAQSPVDWKYQVYVKCCKEYRNFKRYALVYGLLFCKSDVKLSYVKTDRDHEKNLYYLLNVLGNPIVKYRKYQDVTQSEEITIQLSEQQKKEFDEYDFYRFNVCPYKFLLESITENNTVYKDEFLLKKYMEVVLESKFRRKYEGQMVIESIIDNNIYSLYEKTKKMFPFVKDIDQVDIITNVKTRLLNTPGKKYQKADTDSERYIKIKELFIHRKLDKKEDKFPVIDQEKINKSLSTDELNAIDYKRFLSGWCTYCSNKNLCALQEENEG